MTQYGRLVWEAWCTYKPQPPGHFEYLHTPFPLGTRFAFRRDEHRQLRACFIEYDLHGYVRMLYSYIVKEE